MYTDTVYTLLMHQWKKEYTLIYSNVLQQDSSYIPWSLINHVFLLSLPGVYKASEARLLLLMYQVNYVNQGNQLKDSAISPAKIIDDSWTMDGFVSGNGHKGINLV